MHDTAKSQRRAEARATGHYSSRLYSTHEAPTRDRVFLGWAIDTDTNSLLFPARIFSRESVASMVTLAKQAGIDVTVRTLTPEDVR